MDSLALPLEGFVSAMSAFVQTPSTKLLHAHVAVKMRKASVSTAMAFERDRHNTAPFYLFEQPHTLTDQGWAERCEHARNQHAHRAELMEKAEHDESLAPLADAPATPDPTARFAAQLLQLAESGPHGSHGMIVILAPTSLEGADAWQAAITPLIMDAKLAAVRFVVMETPPAPTAALAESLGDRGALVEVVPDADDYKSDMEALLSSIEPGAGMPGASPQAAPPPHPSKPPEHPPDESFAMRSAISKKLLASMLATLKGQMPEAVRATREARDLSKQAGDKREAVNLQLALGGQLMAAGGGKQSEQSFQQAIAEADDNGDKDQVATGNFALGATKLSRQDKQGALVAYAEGTVAAEQCNQPALAIEGGRLTGQLASDLGMQAQAIAFWTKAVKLADKAGPLAPMTSAGQSARSLAALCRKRGLGDQAAKFEAQADQLENIVVPDAPTIVGDVPTHNEDASETDAVPAGDAQSPDFLPVGVAAAPAGAFGGPAPVTQDVAHDAEAAHFEGTDDSLGELDETQLERLRLATLDALDEDSTSMLSRAELAELTGEQPFVIPPQDAPPPTPPAEPEPEPDLGFDLSKLDALRDADIDDEEDGGATIRRRDTFED